MSVSRKEAAAVTVVNPAVGIAIGVGLAVVTLLVKIVGGGG
jgi:hypothetical protein